MPIDFREKRRQKEEKYEREFLELLSQFKDQETIMEINLILVELQDTSPELFELACDYIKFVYEQTLSESMPDITA
jgi:hypothetical protein